MLYWSYLGAKRKTMWPVFKRRWLRGSHVRIMTRSFWEYNCTFIGKPIVCTRPAGYYFNNKSRMEGVDRTLATNPPLPEPATDPNVGPTVSICTKLDDRQHLLEKIRDIKFRVSMNGLSGHLRLSLWWERLESSERQERELNWVISNKLSFIRSAKN